MGRKLTHEEFMQRVMEKNEHVKNGEIEILGMYDGNKKPIQCRCVTHDFIWHPKPNDLCSGVGCKKCGTERAHRSSKSTHEEFLNKVMKNNEQVRNGNVEILGTYTSRNKPIQCRCVIHDYIWSPLAYSLYENHGCPKCYQRKIETCKPKKTHDQFVKDLSVVNNSIVVVGVYSGVDVKIDFKCNSDHIFKASPGDVLQGRGCPYCAGKKVLVGYNDIHTTHPHIGALMANFDDGYKYSAHSGKKIDFKCPDCGYIQAKTISSVTNRGFTCQQCSDKISYPNRFGREVLSQLPINGFKAEWRPEWLKPYFYDNMFKILDKVYVLEMDGALGHGNETYKTHIQDVKGLERDNIKDELAQQHNVKVIRVDCKKSEFYYIMNNLLSSELSNLFDLSCINWELCDMNAQKNLVKESCNMYMNDNKSINEIAEILHLSTKTIRDYLKKGENFGWCDYSNYKYKRRRINNTKLMEGGIANGT